MTGPEAEVAVPGEMMEWPALTGQATTEMAPICGKCGSSVSFVGKLPAIRLLPLLRIYKCPPCNLVITVPS
jgi:hypothetical protein